MPEVDAMDFYDRVVSSEERTKQYVLEAVDGTELTVELTVIERGDLLDQISKLPDEMLDTLEEASDGEEAQEEAQEQNMLSSVDGSVVDAFEEICAESMQHRDYTSHNTKQLAESLSMDTLFPLGAEIIDFSLENEGKIQGFRKAD